MFNFYAGSTGQARCFIFQLLFITGCVSPQIEASEEWNRLDNFKPWKEEMVKRLQPPTDQDCLCGSGEVSCVTECRCVSTNQICDGVFDCPGGHDESSCAKQLCHGRFACMNGVCIRNEFTCDNRDDCGDNSDEHMCRANGPTAPYNCSSVNQFNCTDGEYCVPIGWRCDGDFDCHDKSDEANCLFNATCHPAEFKCRTGHCISFNGVCDGTLDCVDGSDELNCGSTKAPPKCSKTEFQCKTVGRCVANHYRCDGEDDCGDWSDETSCGNKTSCSPDSFRCDSGRCIERGWICDGSPDCDGEEDEKNCPKYINPEDCPKDTVWCPKICISPDWKCDGEIDCLGGEDEINCEGDVTCDKDLFTCSSGECLRWQQVCDGYHDCLNGKDELHCNITNCPNLQCSSMCHKSKEGKERCICQSGFSLNVDNMTCSDVDECSQFRPCSQLCENVVGSFKCKCVRGYRLRPDGTSCKATSPPARLIFATRDDVREINLSGQEYPAIALNLENAIAVDFHYRRGLIYWTDVTIDAILMSYRNGSGKTEIVRWGLQQPCGLAVDWHNEHIYWVDSISRRVEVADLDGSNRRPLIWTNLQKPRSIIVHPMKSIIIWTDWGDNARIEQAYMDGSGRKVLIGERLFWPNGITIDYPTETLYWVDAKQHVIEAAHIDGTQRRKVNEQKIPHPFAITVFEDRLYLTDWITRSIRSINKRTGRDAIVVHADVAFPMGIKSLHPQRQPLLNQGERVGCSWNNGGCSHLCLPGANGCTCFCPNGLFLLENGLTCSDQPDLLLLFAQRNSLRMISLYDELHTSNDQVQFFEKSVFKTIDESDAVDGEGVYRYKMDNVVPVDSIQTAMALDFDDKNDMIYWTDIDARSISRAHINGSGQQILVSSNLELPGGLALDWINHKLYWTDDGTDRIEVSNLDGSNRAILIWNHLHHPRDIVVDPEEGLLFWSEWGQNATIVRANMDGTDRLVVVDSKLKWPNGLAIDHKTSKLYWLDAHYQVVEWSDLDGSKRRKLFSEDLSHPFGLSLYGNYIFWSDWKTMSIYMADKNTGIGRQQLVQGLKGLMDVRIFHHRSINSSFENPCERRNGGCSHLCLLKPRGNSCSCPTGLMLQDDKKKCKTSPSKWLVMAHRTLVRSLSLDTPYLADVVLRLPTLHNVVALDVDPVTGDIFLPDEAAGLIFRCSNDGLNCDGVVKSTVTTVEGIAIEATTRKMYWTDLDRKSIEVSELDGSYRRILFTRLDKPRAITTHYPSGKLFWTDWADHHPRIQVADLDGQMRRIFVNTSIAWPNGLTVDWDTAELYWTDAKLNRIEAIRLDGRNRRTVVVGSDVRHPYGVAVLEQWVYWSDWESKALYRANKKSGKEITALRTGLAGLMDLKALPGSAPSKNICGKNNGGCSHLCLRNPSGFSCTCPTGLILTDKKNCASVPSKYLLVASRGLIRRVSLDTHPLWDVGIEIPGTNHPVSVDIHYKKQLLFFTDTDVDAIKVVSLKDYNVAPESIPTHAFTSPDGLVIDWVADNIYWTDVANKVIEVAKIESYSQKVIVRSDLQEPRAMAVFPSKGYLFWTDWGNESKIERASLDGSDRIVLISSDIGWPNGLVVDLNKNRLYWTDAQKDSLETADLDGNDRVVLVAKLLHPFGVTLLDQHVYWTDWEKKGIERADKSDGRNKQLIVTYIEEPMEVVAVDANGQSGWNACARRNGGCTHLCLFRSNLTVACACPDAPTPSCSTSPLFKVDALGDGGPNAADRRESSETSRSNNSGLLTAVVVTGVVAVIVIASSVAGLFWFRANKAKKAVEGTKVQGGTLTYTNPTYATSHSDVNTDRKPFTWRRLHHDNQQGQLFEEKGEVVALISEGSSVEHESPPSTPSNHFRPAPR